MDDRNIGEGVKVIPIWMHNYEEPVLAQQIDQISPEKLKQTCQLQMQDRVDQSKYESPVKRMKEYL